MSKLNVAVIFGGCSTEHDVSKKSVITILNGLSLEKYNIIPVYISKEGSWFLYDGNYAGISTIDIESVGTSCILSPDPLHKGLLRIVGSKVKTVPVDVIIPVLHGKNGEDGSIQGLFQLARIPYVGCNIISSAMAMDKGYTKIVVDTLPVNQTPYMIYNYYECENMDDITKDIRSKLGYPVFVKPANAGSSVGISRAKNKKELLKAFEIAFNEDSKVIVEKAIEGKEVECAVLGNGADSNLASPIGEVLAAAEFYDYDAKYNNPDSKTLIPADIPEEIAEAIKCQSVEIFKKLGCSGLSRVDFFVENGTNKIIFNEINTFPGFTSISMYPMLMKAMGKDLTVLLDDLIQLAITNKF